MIAFHVNSNLICWHAITRRRFLRNQTSADVLELQRLTDPELAGKLARLTPTQALADPFLSSLAQHPSARRLLEQTQASLEPLLREWESNFARSQEILMDLSGLQFERSLPVYLTHPVQPQGRYCDDPDLILWTYRQDWPNYNTVYLWHLTLYAYLPGGLVSQAVLELLTDEELRIRLNGGSYPAFVGHHYTMPIKLALLQDWRDYLASPNRNIHDFLKQAQRRANSMLSGGPSSN